MTWLRVLLTAGIVLDHAHLVSPVAVAWSNTGFRRHMLQRPEKFILLPAAVIVFGAVFGMRAQRHDLGFELMAAVYLLWNSYHFGMQNYGLLALCGHRGIGFVCLCTTMLAMSVLPLSVYGAAPATVLIMGGISFAHWISDIGLSTVVSPRRVLFLCGVLMLGFVGLSIKQVDALGRVMITAGPFLLSLRICAGFVHFLYSRWVWRLSDPQVRATIGRELFAPCA